ncbi:MAG: PorT family protein [Flavobacteriaceae bacterium]|nr:PorT family protein [Flavobacteriaceae bacterium]
MSKDLEDIFSKAFGAFEKTPSERVWDGIAKDREEKQRLGITEATPESEMTHGLSNLAAEPGEGVWQAIAHNRFMKLMQRRALRIAAGILLLLAIGLAANSLMEKGDGNGKVEAGGKKEEGSTKSNGNNQQSADNSKQPTVNSQQFPKQGQQPIEISSRSLIGSQQSIGNTQPTTTISEPSNTSPEPTPVNSQLISNNQHIMVATKGLIDLPIAKLSMSKLPKPKLINSPYKDHFFYIPTLASSKKYGDNYTKYNRETDLNNEGSRFKFGVAIGVELSKFKTSGDNTYYQRMRAVGYEGRLNSFSGSFSANFRVFKDWYLQSGVNFVRRSASPHYDATFVRTVMTVGGSGDTTYVKVIDYEINSKTSYHLTHLELPFLIGRSIGDKRGSMHFAAGTSYNVLIDKGGYMLSAVNMRAASLNNPASHSFTKASWGFMANAGMAIQIKHELSFTLDGVFKYYKNMFANGYPATQTLRSLGGNVGIRYHLR